MAEREIKRKYVLTYFNARGLGEPIRYLLSYSDLEFEDRRVDFESWSKLKQTMPNGQVPTLQIGNMTMFQSLAICRYLATKVGLNGQNEWEDAEIDMAVYTISDLRSKASAVAFEKDEAIKEKKYGTLLAETIPSHLKTLEKLASANNGFMALKRLTWADFYLAGILDTLNYMCRQDVTANNPNLKQVVENVRSLPAIKQWLEKAPKTEF